MAWVPGASFRGARTDNDDPSVASVRNLLEFDGWGKESCMAGRFTACGAARRRVQA